MSRAGLWVCHGTAVAVAFACAAYPMYVIRPFRAQGAVELAAALAVARWGFPMAGLCAVAGVASAWGLSGGGRWWSGVVAVAGALLTCGFAALTRVNVFELMFHRIDAPAFTSARDAKVDAGDMVLAVQVGGAVRAYPVRTLTYHHIVNDRLGGAALVATY